MRNVYGTDYVDDKDSMNKENRSLWKVMYFLIVIVILLGIGYLNLKDNIRIVIKMPPAQYKSDKHIILGLNSANVSYYEIWGRYLINEFSNFTPDDINEKVNLVINEMRPSDAVKKIDEAHDFKAGIVVNKISQEFDFIKVTTILNDNEDVGKVIVDGISRTKTGDTDNKVKECSYEIKFKFVEGVFYVKNFGTNCF